MSFFGVGGSGSAQVSNEESRARMMMAKAEMENMQDMFSRMVDLCYQKCVSQYKEPDMNVGELSCVDRCVAKYMQVHFRVGTKLQGESAGASQ